MVAVGEIGAARAALFPRISLTGLVGFASNALSTLFTGGAFNYSVAPSVSYPIFQAGAGRANVRYTEAQRDAAHSEADAQHREALAQSAAQRQEDVARSTSQLLELLQQNTELTAITKQLTERIEILTQEVHRHILSSDSAAS